MKTYNVIWEERHSVNVKAENEEEAIEKIHSGDYDEAGEAAQLSGQPEAHEFFEIKLK